MIRKGLLTISMTILMASCAGIQADKGAEMIKITNKEPKGCQYLGDVMGMTGGITAGYTSTEKLVNGARNDIKNKAFKLGGNVIHLLSTQKEFGRYGGIVGETLEGVAYKCPIDQVIPQ